MAEARVIAFRTRDSSLDEEARIAARLANDIFDGNPDAETLMIKRYSKGLRYLLRKRTNDDERARDLLQETFCIAIEKLRQTELDNPERLAGYLRGIAVRVAMNAGRRRNREPYPMEIEAVAAIPDNEPQQYQQMSSAQTSAAVRELLESMPIERDRDLLIRLYVYDQDKDEICRALSLDSLHFNRVLFRAKNRFKIILVKAAEIANRVPENVD